MHWDIFCRVIDNFGDIGVCWRLSADLAARGHCVRLWADQTEALEWMAPGALQGHWPGIRVLPWDASADPALLHGLTPSQVWIEGFGCALPEAFVAHFAPLQAARPPAWINLEYLSAEPYVARSHGLPSPVMSGPAKGWLKYFYYPGFTPSTGGLLREPHIANREADLTAEETTQFLASLGIDWAGELLLTLFCYADAPVASLLSGLAGAADGGQGVMVLATHGIAQRLLAALPPPPPGIRIAALPALPQSAFDTVLRCADINFVRGEDSLVRAIWAQKPYIWNIYPQDDGAHAVKLQAFLQTMQLGSAPDTLHWAWNGWPNAATGEDQWAALRAPERGKWRSRLRDSAQRLHANQDLTSGLIDFVNKKS